MRLYPLAAAIDSRSPSGASSSADATPPATTTASARRVTDRLSTTQLDASRMQREDRGLLEDLDPGANQRVGDAVAQRLRPHPPVSARDQATDHGFAQRRLELEQLPGRQPVERLE